MPRTRNRTKLDTALTRACGVLLLAAVAVGCGGGGGGGVTSVATANAQVPQAVVCQDTELGPIDCPANTHTTVAQCVITTPTTAANWNIVCVSHVDFDNNNGVAGTWVHAQVDNYICDGDGVPVPPVAGDAAHDTCVNGSITMPGGSSQNIAAIANVGPGSGTCSGTLICWALPVPQ